MDCPCGKATDKPLTEWKPVQGVEDLRAAMAAGYSVHDGDGDCVLRVVPRDEFRRDYDYIEDLDVWEADWIADGASLEDVLLYEYASTDGPKLTYTDVNECIVDEAWTLPPLSEDQVQAAIKSILTGTIDD